MGLALKSQVIAHYTAKTRMQLSQHLRLNCIRGEVVCGSGIGYPRNLYTLLVKDAGIRLEQSKDGVTHPTPLHTGFAVITHVRFAASDRCIEHFRCSRNPTWAVPKFCMVW